MTMPTIENQVAYIDSLKNEYGNKLKEVMIANLTAMSVLVGMQTLAFGLATDDPAYIDAFAAAGGDVEYLNFVVKVFKEVREDICGL